MVYIVVLNWNGFADTADCLSSLLTLVGCEFKIVVCDNDSHDDSYANLVDWGYERNDRGLVVKEVGLAEISVDISMESYNLFFIKNNSNLGFAGGNNPGIRFALNQSDMKYAWLLNNDTEVDSHALTALLNKCCSNKKIGVCGSKLVYFHNRSLLQGVGGVYNPWLCTSKHYGAFLPSDTIFDEKKVDNSIDYVIGASMLISKECLQEIGILCEDYFLYYEEIDFCLRAKKKFEIATCTESIVYHKEGASTESGKSYLADYYSVRNRLRVTKKYYPYHIVTVWSSLAIVAINRLRRLEFKKMLVVLKIMVTGH